MKWLALLILVIVGCGAQPLPLTSPQTLEVWPELERVGLTWETDVEASDNQQPRKQSPLSLTASDGTGLRLVWMKARASVEGPLAMTELNLTFVNPEGRRLEGTFEITLPQGATVSRFAMKLPTGWQEGEVVERSLARQAYEDFLHRKIDPALLEKQAGNRFRARVFPIEALEKKEIILSYSEELNHTHDPYRLNLQGLPRLDSLDIELLVPTMGKSYWIQKDGFAPDRDFVFSFHRFAKRSATPPVEALRHENLVVARITPLSEATAPEPIQGLTILFDTSASRSLGFNRQVDQLKDILAAIRKTTGGAVPLQVFCFDQEVEEVFRGKASDFGDAEVAKIIKRGALGATNLQHALEGVAASSRNGRLVVITDGITTVGEHQALKLGSAVARLKTAGFRRTDVIVNGGIRDEKLLKALVSSGLDQRGTVMDASLPPALIVQKLLRSTKSVQVHVPASAWVWPSIMENAQPGDQMLVYADIPPDRPFKITLNNGDPQVIQTTPAPKPLLERAWIQARIESLESGINPLASQEEQASSRKQIIELSTRHRVLSDYTSFLVLETEADYERYGIRRTSLADVLTVGERGVETLKRSDFVLYMADASTAGQPWDQRDLLRFRGPPTPGQPPAQTTSQAQTGSGVDADRDGIPDAMDQCPMEPETYNGITDDDGCPDRGLVVIRESEIRIIQTILFSANGTTVLPESMPVVDAAAQVMKTHPEIRQVEIGGHTDNRGSDVANLRLSEARANAVRDIMIRAGVQPDRLIAKGYGVTRPIVSNDTAENRAKNRRVEFRILQMDQSAASAFRSSTTTWTPPKPTSEAAVSPYSGNLLEVMTLIQNGKVEEAVYTAIAWQLQTPGDALSLIGLGEAFEAAGRPKLAARAYGSLIDLYPSRADLRRYAGERLERVAQKWPDALDVAIDSYRKALVDRPDHPSSHRLLAYALARKGQFEEALSILLAAVKRSYPRDRFIGVDRILRDDIGLIGAAYAKQTPDRKGNIMANVQAVGAQFQTTPSLRFVLSWETDVNDVDLHVLDGQGNHAYHASKKLASGGELIADVTTGYGPESFVIGAAAGAYPYQIQVHYYSRGPMGYGMGKVEVVEHDGAGGLLFDERPFVVMNDKAHVNLGKWEMGHRP